MAGFGVSLDEAAQRLEKYLPDTGEQRDWSVDAALFLALSYLALQRVEQRGGIFRLAGKLLVFPALERAWQELMHIRVRLPEDLTTDINRDIEVTKTGRVIYGREIRSTTQRRPNGDSDDQHQSLKGDISARYAARVRSRRNRKPNSTAVR